MLLGNLGCRDGVGRKMMQRIPMITAAINTFHEVNTKIRTMAVNSAYMAEA